MISKEQVNVVIGKGFADKLEEEVFKVGTTWTYTRREMVEELDCANFIAAVRLAKVLSKLGIHTPTQLSKLDPFSLARAKGIGEAALFVAMCILDHSGYDVIKWWHYKNNTTKFSTFKHHTIRKASKRKHEV